MATKEYNAQVVYRKDVTNGLMILGVQPDTPFAYEAGQYTVLGMKQGAPRVETAQSDEVKDTEKLIQRAYSIASFHETGKPIEFYITLVNEGGLTPRIFNLAVGDRLYIGKKATGIFTLEKVPADSHVILVGTGTGLAPYMGMIGQHFKRNGGQKYAVIHGCRWEEDLGYRDALEQLAKDNDNFFYKPILSQPVEQTGWTGKTGYVQDYLFSNEFQADTGIPIDPKQSHVFLCGNPLMIKTVQAELESREYTMQTVKEDGSLHIEEYW